MKLKWTVGVCALGLAIPLALPRTDANVRGSVAAVDQPEILVGAGDIADCNDLSGAQATAKLLEQIPGTVMAVGDLAYPDGTKENFACYEKTWGRVRNRTRPAPGNHEFHSAGAKVYFEYFGAAAGDPKDGYYSYELGTWHIVVLNSECVNIGGCDAGSRELRWLRADLAAHPAACTLAYYHKPLFSSGSAHGNDYEMKPLWQALYDGNADVIINGHDHNYERFAPQNAAGVSDAERGIREFVVGTGGKNHRPILLAKPNSESRNADAFGVLKLTLRTGAYDWQFVRPRPENRSWIQEQRSATSTERERGAPIRKSHFPAELADDAV